MYIHVCMEGWIYKIYTASLLVCNFNLLQLHLKSISVCKLLVIAIYTKDPSLMTFQYVQINLLC